MHDETESAAERRARIEATMHQLAEERRLALERIGFEWRTCRKQDHGKLRRHPMEPPATPFVTLVTGRQTWLHQFHQYFVYAGVLCGAPDTPELALIHAYKTVKRALVCWEYDPVFLEPTLRTGYFRLDEQGRPDPSELTWLPKVCSIALVRSEARVRDSDPGRSFLSVVWFQDEFGLPNDAGILEELANIDWDGRAFECTL